MSMENICNVCFQSGELYQLAGYSFPTCLKCSESLSEGILPKFYHDLRYGAPPSTSTGGGIQFHTQQLIPPKKEPTSVPGPSTATSAPSEVRKEHGNTSSEDLTDSQFKCPKCTKKFARKTSLIAHLECHSTERRFVCRWCLKRFTHQANLINHERVHTGERPFKCPECSKGFTQVTNLNNHRRLHSGDRPYVCSQPGCGSAFAQVTNLNSHLKTCHNVVPKHDCTVCAESFPTKRELRTHVQEQHSDVRSVPASKSGPSKAEEVKLPCLFPNCPVKFPRLDSLYTHLKVAHGDSFNNSAGRSDEESSNLQDSVSATEDPLSILPEKVEAIPLCISPSPSTNYTEAFSNFIVQRSAELEQAVKTPTRTLKCAHCSNLFKKEKTLAHHVKKYHS